jgi:hypothetical protein
MSSCSSSTACIFLRIEHTSFVKTIYYYEVFSLSTDYPILHTLLPIRIYGFTLSISPIDTSIVLFPYYNYLTIHFLPLLFPGMGEWRGGSLILPFVLNI